MSFSISIRVTYSPVIAIEDQFSIFKVEDKQPEISFTEVNRVMDKKALRDLVDFAYRNLGSKQTVILADRLKDTGYRMSTEAGLSIAIDDMLIPESKWKILKAADKKVAEIGNQYSEGTHYHRRESTIRWWISGPRPRMMWPQK